MKAIRQDISQASNSRSKAHACVFPLPCTDRESDSRFNCPNLCPLKNPPVKRGSSTIRAYGLLPLLNHIPADFRQIARAIVALVLSREAGE